jgi:hypothetical protein
MHQTCWFVFWIPQLVIIWSVSVCGTQRGWTSLLIIFVFREQTFCGFLILFMRQKTYFKLQLAYLTSSICFSCVLLQHCNRSEHFAYCFVFVYFFVRLTFIVFALFFISTKTFCKRSWPEVNKSKVYHHVLKVTLKLIDEYSLNNLHYLVV